VTLEFGRSDQRPNPLIEVQSATASLALARELANQLLINPEAIDEAMRRGLLTFTKKQRVVCWLFGDAANGCLRRVDGQLFKIRGKSVKALATSSGTSWHRLIGLDDVVANDRREILLLPEGSKDALGAFHLAAAEDRLSDIGLAVALGSAVKLLQEDTEKFRGRRVRILGDADPAGQNAAQRIAKQLAPIAEEVQIFDLAGLHCRDGSAVKDVFDLTRIDRNEFEANPDLGSVTDLAIKGKRVKIITGKHEFFPSPPLPPLEVSGSLGSRVDPVSSSQELEKELVELAERNACIGAGTARRRRFKLLRDLAAVEIRINRKLNPGELMKTFETWYESSQSHLDPKKTHDDYLGAFYAELGKVRVPTGQGGALQAALALVSALPIDELPQLPGMAEPPESWRRVAALHRELARQSPNGAYFVSCRDTAKVHHSLNKDSAGDINHALVRLGVIEFVRIGDACPGGKASDFRYMLPL
jgi:hypothetical protein